MAQKQIGKIVHVDGEAIQVRMNNKDAGEPRGNGSAQRAGQIGSYVTVPVGENRVIGWVQGMSEEPSADLHGSAEVILEVMLVGTLRGGRFEHGVSAYPLVGDAVHNAEAADFDLIFGAFKAASKASQHPRTFKIGRFALNPDFDVHVLGKEFFCKHAAVLGNSGSGKSCTAATILQQVSRMSGAQVVLFDLHDEYRAAFTGPDGTIHKNCTYLSQADFIVPYWLLHYDELEELFVDYSNPLHIDNQSSFLRMAIQKLKGHTAQELGLETEVTLDTPIYFDLQQLKQYAENLNDARYVMDTDRLAFVDLAYRNRSPEEQEKLMISERCEFHQGSSKGETVHPLYHSALIGLINKIDTKLSDQRYDFAMRPLEHARRSSQLRDLIAPLESAGKRSETLIHLLNVLMGRGRRKSNITILDLSGVPFDMVDITVSLITRLMLQFNFWTPIERRHPTLLVYEEAHNYIPKETPKRGFAREAVEKVVKEGRKYGVSAVVISQRPSELSETVLSQCNNMVILRMSNPADQEYVAKVISDQFASMVRSLPVLRPGEGFIIGDSTLMPMRCLIDMPNPSPASGDIDFFKHWSQERPPEFTNQVVDLWWRQERGRAHR